jgi:hypothetical protein
MGNHPTRPPAVDSLLRHVCGSEKSLLLFAIAALSLSTFSADSARQLDVLGHDGHALCVDRAQVRVLEQADEVGLARLLQGHHGRALEAQVRLEVLSDLAHQTLERQLADQQLRALLVTADLAQRHGPGPVTMGLLHAPSRRCALARRLRGELLARSLATGRFASCLLRTCHYLFFKNLLDSKSLVSELNVYLLEHSVKNLRVFAYIDAHAPASSSLAQFSIRLCRETIPLVTVQILITRTIRRRISIPFWR